MGGRVFSPAMGEGALIQTCVSPERMHLLPSPFDKFGVVGSRRVAWRRSRRVTNEGRALVVLKLKQPS